jgi:hypothetical protein
MACKHIESWIYWDVVLLALAIRGLFDWRSGRLRMQ